MHFILLPSLLILSSWSALAQSGGTGSGAAGYGTDTKQTGAPAGPGGAASDWTSYWWIIAAVIVLMILLTLFAAWRRRP